MRPSSRTSLSRTRARASGPSGRAAGGDGKPRWALVTGAGRGIGAAISQRLALDGLRVVCADIDARNAERTAAALPGAGHAGRYVDVADEQGVESLFDSVESGCGPVAILVCAAGLLALDRDGKRPPIAAMTMEHWQRTFAVNAQGTFLCCRAYLGRREKRPVDHGRVVTFASVAAQIGGYNASAAYIAAKAAIIGFTKAFAREASRLGITANAVAPGLIDTDMMRMAAGSAGITSAVTANIPLGRLGSAEEVAAVVRFLVSEEATYVTGATIDVNGGYRMQ